MRSTSAHHTITSIDELEALYEPARPISLMKELDHLNEHYQAFVEASPFVIIASCGPEGLDCSPRGDPPGFVRVHDARTVMIPDRRGNNRLDTLRNIIRNPHISLLFLIPGIGETLRINGTAKIMVEPELRTSFAVQGKSPKSVIQITIDSVYYQCQKALARSKLWHAETHVDRATLPTAGQMAETLSTEPFDGAAYDRDYPERLKKTMY